MKKFFKNYGFTLFELLAVLAILAIIAGIAVPQVMRTIKNARIQSLQSEMQLVANSVQRWLMEEEIMERSVNGPFHLAGGDVVEGELKYLTANVPVYSAATHSEDDTNAAAIIEYIEGGIPEYLVVYVVDKGYTAVGAGAATRVATIEVIYDEDVTVNSFGSIEAVDLSDNVVDRSFEYSGTFANHYGE